MDMKGDDYFKDTETGFQHAGTGRHYLNEAV